MIIYCEGCQKPTIVICGQQPNVNYASRAVGVGQHSRAIIGHGTCYKTCPQCGHVGRYELRGNDETLAG